jgi:hypothetical protein
MTLGTTNSTLGSEQRDIPKEFHGSSKKNEIRPAGQIDGNAVAGNEICYKSSNSWQTIRFFQTY